MSAPTRLWQCPGCAETYHIPQERADPTICRVCQQAEDAKTRDWQCPACLDTFRIPQHEADPDFCRDCERNFAASKKQPPPIRRDSDERSQVFKGVLFAGICVVLAIAWLASPNAEIDKQMERSRELNDESRAIHDRQTERIIEEGMRLGSEEPEVERDWVTVGEWQGSGPKTTERFQSVTGDLLITWAARAGEFGGGSFSIFIEGEEVDLAANQVIQSSESDSTRFHGSPGTYYLKIDSVNSSWSVSVSDWR